MTNKNLKELFIKLKNVFPKDMYIIKGKYCIEGPGSKTKNYGSCITVLDNKWLDTLTEFLDESELSKECVYVNVIDNAKKFADGDDLKLEDIFSDYDNYHTLVDELLSNLNLIDTLSDEWKQFSEDSGFIEDVFTNKGIYKLDAGDSDAIRIGKPALPLVTEKTVNKLFYNVSYDDKLDMYHLYMKYNFTHFQVYMLYSAIPMKK